VTALLRQVKALVVEGHTLAKALAAVADPFGAYATWSPLWDLLYEAQESPPKVTLHDLQDLSARSDVLALVDRAIAAAERTDVQGFVDRGVSYVEGSAQ
jgi:hypothetical protein